MLPSCQLFYWNPSPSSQVPNLLLFLLLGGQLLVCLGLDVGHGRLVVVRGRRVPDEFLRATGVRIDLETIQSLPGVVEKFLHFNSCAHWVWLDWHSGNFRNQRLAVHIPQLFFSQLAEKRHKIRSLGPWLRPSERSGCFRLYRPAAV